MDLQNIRGELDQIDASIVKLYEERMKLCKEVAEFKIENGKPVLDQEREKQKIQKVKEMVPGELQIGIEELFRFIMSSSRKLQYQLMTEHGMGIRFPFIPVEVLDKENTRVIYQGVEGAYSHQGAMQFFGETHPFRHVETFEDAMRAINQGEADYAVLPIENSSAGMVGDMYDLLVNYDNYIVGETFVKVEHALLGLPEAEIEDIRVVYSHPQGLMQSSKYLDQHREWKQERQENTAGSAKRVWDQQDKSCGAIASETAGRLYGLKVLKKPVNHESNNTTRFIIVTGQKIFLKTASKCSISFELAHESGSLYQMLSHFIHNHVNLTKIESRPIPEKTWEYRFFIDFEGNLNDSGVRNALKGISEEANALKILGNY